MLGHFKGRKLNETSKRLVVTASSKSMTLLAPPLPALDDKRTAEIKEVIRLALEAKFRERALLKGRKIYIRPEARHTSTFAVGFYIGGQKNHSQRVQRTTRSVV